MDEKAAPGLRGTPPDAVVFGAKVSVRARYLHIIIWNGYEIVGKARSPLGIPQRRMPGRAAHGRNHAGERLACCIVFFPAILWCVPRFLGAIGSPFRTETLVQHPFGIQGRAEPAGVCAPPTGGEGDILSHNLFYYVNFIPREETAKCFPPMPGICAIRCNRMLRIVIEKVLTQWNCKKKIPPRFRTRWDLEPKALTKGRKRGVAVYSSKDFRRSRGKA